MNAFERLAYFAKATLSATASALGVALIASPVYAVAGDVAGGGASAATSSTPTQIGRAHV